MIYITFSFKGYKKALPVCPAAAPAGHRPLIRTKDAFGNDFDACMIHRWTAATGNGVLRTSPTASCSSKDHVRLCYGADIPARRPDNAQYISCYNTARLIPEFTAYVVPYSPTPIAPGYKRPPFEEDKGPCGRYHQYQNIKSIQEAE